MNAVTVVIFAMVATLAWAQYQPGYAPFGHRYPQPIAPDTGDASLDNRFAGTEAPAPAVNGNGFSNEQVGVVQNYPDGKKPFWFINQQAIAQHIGKTTQQPTSTSTSTEASNSTATDTQ